MNKTWTTEERLRIMFIKLGPGVAYCKVCKENVVLEENDTVGFMEHLHCGPHIRRTIDQYVLVALEKEDKYNYQFQGTSDFVQDEVAAQRFKENLIEKKVSVTQSELKTDSDDVNRTFPLQQKKWRKTAKHKNESVE